MVNDQSLQLPTVHPNAFMVLPFISIYKRSHFTVSLNFKSDEHWAYELTILKPSFAI